MYEVMIVIVALFIGIFYLYKSKKTQVLRGASLPVVDLPEQLTDQQLPVANENFLALQPTITSLAPSQVDETKQHEITDKRVIARLNGLIPNVVNEAAMHANHKNAKELKEFLSNKDIYQVILPQNAELYRSAAMPNAFRGGFHVNNQLKGQANFKPISPNDLSIAQMSPKLAAAGQVMNAAAMVVGQYYMAEIDAKLENLVSDVEKIADFQELEFKARILSLVSKVGKISKFNAEIIENDEVRQRQLDSLSRYNDEAIELLQQVNLTLGNIIDKNPKNDYPKYKANIRECDKLTQYQYYLTTILEEITRLDYLLHKGAQSYELTYTQFNDYLVQSNQVRKKLATWHQRQLDFLGIDLNKKRREKKDFLGRFQGVFNNDWKFHRISEPMIKQIKIQLNSELKIQNATQDLLDKETKINIVDGKYYYLTD